LRKIDNESSDRAPAIRTLRDQHLEAVSGGFGFVERGIGVDSGKLLGSPEEIGPPVLVGRS
jgi:hypothetical protein